MKFVDGRTDFRAAPIFNIDIAASGAVQVRAADGNGLQAPHSFGVAALEFLGRKPLIDISIYDVNTLNIIRGVDHQSEFRVWKLLNLQRDEILFSRACIDRPREA